MSCPMHVVRVIYELVNPLERCKTLNFAYNEGEIFEKADAKTNPLQCDFFVRPVADLRLLLCPPRSTDFVLIVFDS